MRTFIEASVVLIVAIALTLAIMAVIFPRHALGGLDRAVESPTLWPAVFVEGTHDRLGSGHPADPKSADTGATAVCPYLAALASASKKPAGPERGNELTCPYLQQLQRQLREAGKTQTAAHGHHI